MQLYSDGLYLDGRVIVGPLGFSGDFSMTLNFTLNTSSSGLPMFEVILSDGASPPFPESISASFISIGDPSEKYVINKNGSSVTNGTAIPSISRTGANALKIIKSGSTFEVKINGTTLTVFDMGAVSFEHFVPYLNIDASYESQIRVKSITFKYGGTTAPRPAW